MAPKKQVDPNELMIVNDSPGEECRIAILQDNHLEELYTERTATATNVGNIYKGRVVNVEPAIQAAFIDYGQGANGFLHISDLHPKYFPGEERTERVGKKIPRRERPPIQAALRRGQEILVQVLKEGIGTKGPTLTSYLSIPGRLLVLMPDMDRVGVSRKVEDEQKRREMRQILDSLDLPDGFGFILRTAGYGKTKTELKRDAAYLMRLWRVMERRIKTVGAPCELYTESDLLIRTVRDVLRPSIGAIVVDSESAFERASTFLRVVSPRSAPKVVRYHRSAPIFHAFDIERQIELIHSREVPLPSGGRLVIDQTEALVAIDVNSGKSRSARDSETNAYETDCEAADEICRQLRLRDLGGLIVHDLIDMRSAKHRKQIEERFTNLLKLDRAKATVLPISEFGILEMTRQRMRPSLRKSYFMPCPHCSGRGEIRVPEYVAADTARHIGYLLQFDRVRRVEIACSPRVASVLLSAKRRELVRLEDTTGKRVDVRVSDAIAVDRVDFYAYDERNADIDITQLPPLKPPTIDVLDAEQLVAPAAEPLREGVAGDGQRRRGRAGPADAAAMALSEGFDEVLDELQGEEPEEPAEQEEEALGSEMAPQPAADESRRGRGRRRRRRGGGGGAQTVSQQAAGRGLEPEARPPDEAALAEQEPPEPAASPIGEPPPGQSGRGRRSRRRRGRRGRRDEQVSVEPLAKGPEFNETGEQAPSRAEDQADAVFGAPATAESSPDADHPMRVHELAKELSMTSRELIERCEPESGIHHLANSLATVSSEEAQTIRAMFANGAPEQTTATPTADGEFAAPGGVPADGSRRSRRRRGRKRGSRQSIRPGQETAAAPAAIMEEPTEVAEPAPIAMKSFTQPIGEPQGQVPGKKGRRSRRRRRGGKGGGMPQASGLGGAGNSQPSPDPVAPAVPAASNATPPGAGSQSAPARRRKRPLYRAGRVSVSPLARESAVADE